MQAYVRGERVSWDPFVTQVRADPEGTARSLLTLSSVLLDIVSDAFRLSRNEMLSKVTQTIDLHRLEQSRQPTMPNQSS